MLKSLNKCRRATPVAAICAAFLTACVARPPVIPSGKLVPVEFSAIPGWSTDETTAALSALRNGCEKIKDMPAQTSLGGSGIAAARGGQAGQWQSMCAAANVLIDADDPQARQFFETYLTPYRIGGDARFTGYYDPEVPGSLTSGAGFTVPVYGRPHDLMVGLPPADPSQPRIIGRLAGTKIVPYWTRAEIDAGVMGEDAKPIAYLASDVDLFFLQIQGSGRIKLPHGSVMRLAFEAKNGRPYTPIGRSLVAMGALKPDQVSLQTVRAWLLAHPTQARAVMERNESYIFFRIDNQDDPALGPPGALGVALTPNRSAAIDRAFIPLGAPIFLTTTDPITGVKYQHLMLGQDLGTDIKGPARADIFYGAGPTAEATAGTMHGTGALFVLLPRLAE